MSQPPGMGPSSAASSVTTGLVAPAILAYLNDAFISYLTLSALPSGNYGDASHASLFTTDPIGRLTSFTPSPMKVLDQGGQVYNIFGDKWGVNPLNCDSNDYTSKVQAVVNEVCANNGKLLIPKNGRQILLKGPIYFQPSGSARTCIIDVETQGESHGGTNLAFNYIGTSGNIFIFKGIEFSRINLGVNVGSQPKNGVVPFELQFDDSHNAAQSNLFDRCNVVTNANYTTGFRIGQYTDAASNGPFTVFSQCSVTGGTSTSGTIGYQLGGPEAFGTLFLNCGGAQLTHLLHNGSVDTVLTTNLSPGNTTIPVVDSSMLIPSGQVSLNNIVIPYTGKTPTSLTGCTINSSHSAGEVVHQYIPGQGVYSGTDGWYWIGGGGSNNFVDFYIGHPGGHHIQDARLESGTTFLQTNVIDTEFSNSITLDNVSINGYIPSSGGLISLNENTVIDIRNPRFVPASGYFGSNLIVINSIETKGAVNIYGGVIQGTIPFWTSNAPWPIRYKDVRFTDTNLNALSINSQEIVPIVQLPDGTGVNIDTSLGSVFELNMSGGTPSRTLTVSNTFAGSQPFTLYLQQPNSGGPCAVNWFNTIRWGGPTPSLSTGSGAVDKFVFDVYGTNSYLGRYWLNY